MISGTSYGNYSDYGQSYTEKVAQYTAKYIRANKLECDYCGRRIGKYLPTYDMLGLVCTPCRVAG